jgi:Tfp pilus assembly PilM family ATPase
MAIAEGVVCRFTRVVGGGMEAMASELAERRNIAVTDARALISSADLAAPAPDPVQPTPAEPLPEPLPTEPAPPGDDPSAASADPESSATTELYAESLEDGLTASESFAALSEQTSQAPSDGTAPDADVRIVLDNGIREIAGEVRNSLDFHRSQEGGGEVALVVLSGAALDVEGFSDALQAELGVPVTRETVGMADGALAGAPISPQRLAVAAGLSVEEAPR